ncbi:hypothetical protein TUZN_0264 [Thermoproteus uzoniensis 768-20]|uniref:Uncharacterized protein n=1 Tax=Thermoproteus uzoniensis (strain 768-20) TaxID=999630 RepID=F2L221_THEU7|nr:hypothetical protein TUZN_0264 [Thermoproteus uzoniensis 768-20]
MILLGAAMILGGAAAVFVNYNALAISLAGACVLVAGLLYRARDASGRLWATALISAASTGVAAASFAAIAVWAEVLSWITYKALIASLAVCALAALPGYVAVAVELLGKRGAIAKTAAALLLAVAALAFLIALAAISTLFPVVAEPV